MLENENIEQRKIISSNIKKYLTINKMNQKELCDLIGIKPSTMSDYMNLRATPSHGVIQKIADVFSVGKSDIDSTYKTEKTDIEDQTPEFFAIQRNSKKLSQKEQRRLLKIMEATFDKLDNDTFVKDDSDEYL